MAGLVSLFEVRDVLVACGGAAAPRFADRNRRCIALLPRKVRTTYFLRTFYVLST